MKITQPRLENVLHEDTEIQTALEKNDEDLTGYSFKSPPPTGRERNVKNPFSYGYAVTIRICISTIFYKRYLCR